MCVFNKYNFAPENEGTSCGSREGKAIIEYCVFCSDPIFDGEPYAETGEEFYHLDCYEENLLKD